MKIAVISQANQGKDTFCEIVSEIYNVPFVSSTYYIAEHIVFPLLKDKYGYRNLEECLKDKANHRKEWADIINKYNEKDLSKVAKDILSINDFYCGIRCKKQLEASKHLFDLIIWVDASERLGVTENSSSITVTKDDADIIITNNGTKEEFERKVKKVFSLLMTNSQPYEGVEKTLDERKKDFYNEVAKHKDKYSRRELTDFYKYWTEHSNTIRKNTKMKFEKQTTFHVGRRLAWWRKQGQKYSIVGMVKGFNKRKG